MHYIVQNNMFAEVAYDRLIQAVTGHPNTVLHTVRVIPFTHVLTPDPTGIKPSDAVMVFGTGTLSDIANARGWTPGSFRKPPTGAATDPNFEFWRQVAAWGSYTMLNGQSKICDFRDVPPQREPFFIRPTYDGKAFAGTVTDWVEFAEWRDSILRLRPEDGATVTGDTQVQIAPVARDIIRETRLWIIDGRVVTSSLYKVGRLPLFRRDGSRLSNEATRPGVIEFAEQLAHRWTPARAFVMDVAETDRGPRVVECNNINEAGFYDADLPALIAALERAFG